MTLRELRRHWTPDWFRSDARRRLRNQMLRRVGLARCYLPPILVRKPDLGARSLLPFVVARELLQNRNFTFIQIGACDGIDDDDLRQLVVEHHLRGVLVEPQPSAFARLRSTYRDHPNLTLLQAAIDERPGTRDLYCQRGEVSLAASFDRQHLRRHGVPDSEIEAISVPCHTVESALQAGGLDRADLIQIDAEGYDWPIIRSIDLERLRPSIVRFEYRHMTRRDVDACLSHLDSHNYEFLVEERDIIAVRVSSPR